MLTPSCVRPMPSLLKKAVTAALVKGDYVSVFDLIRDKVKDGQAHLDTMEAQAKATIAEAGKMKVEINL